MAHTIREVKKLQNKSRTHAVVAIGHNVYDVESGTSHNHYRVTFLPTGGATCTCDWGKYRPAYTGKRSACSHVQAALKVKTGKYVSFWTNPVDASRQHRPMYSIGDGVIATYRKPSNTGRTCTRTRAMA